jgi:hypothetical protein
LLPTNVAATESAPTPNASPVTEIAQLEPLSVQLPNAVDPTVKFTEPLSAGV